MCWYQQAQYAICGHDAVTPFLCADPPSRWSQRRLCNVQVPHSDWRVTPLGPPLVISHAFCPACKERLENGLQVAAADRAAAESADAAAAAAAAAEEEKEEDQEDQEEQQQQQQQQQGFEANSAGNDAEMVDSAAAAAADAAAQKK